MILVVGGGVVGLHTAIALSQIKNRPEIFLLEKEQFLGDHTSGRNSEVIHAGFAYPVDSWKARLCLEGNGLSYEWLEKLNVPHKKCGKWIVAFNASEVPALEKVMEVGRACRVPGLDYRDAKTLARQEPELKTFPAAIFSATSGMMDAAGYIRALERYFCAQQNCALVYPCGVTAIDPVKKQVETTRGPMEYSVLINCAGLFADEVYKMSGGQNDFQIKPFKGEYYIWRKSKIDVCLYPVPRRYLPGGDKDKRLVSSMGIHLHRSVGGDLYVGPTQVELDWNQKTDYTLITPKETFVEQAAQYAKNCDPANFEPAYAGNRPKLYENGHPLGDFVFVTEGPHVHLLGIDSPGLTAAPAIGKHVASLVQPLL